MSEQYMVYIYHDRGRGEEDMQGSFSMLIKKVGSNALLLPETSMAMVLSVRGSVITKKF